MMDGRVAAIRDALDDETSTTHRFLSYASKFASAFYGPFREAADSAPQFGDRRSYQMDGANLREAMREIELDLDEGADMILMKPAMPYLDMVRAARERFDVPMGAYQVSGEYSMLQAAFQRGWLDREARHAGIAGRHPPRRGGLHRHLLRQGRRKARLKRRPNTAFGRDKTTPQFPRTRFCNVALSFCNRLKTQSRHRAEQTTSRHSAIEPAVSDGGRFWPRS